MRPTTHDILFDPIKLGPVTAKNRFYQVPHCTGMGWHRPQTLSVMRATKAEGGWGVVCTEYCSIHPTSDDASYPYARLWNDEDVKDQALMSDAVHEHGALAGIELWHGGGSVSNFDSRLPALGVVSIPASNAGVFHPGQCRRLDRADILDIRRWHKEAARRAVEAGFDIVYVYATHGYLLSEFLDPSTNRRGDEYGGSLENRTRIVRELIEETLEAVSGRCAVATRFTVDLADEETYDAFALMADMPDLWDLTVNDYSVEMGASRFIKEAALEESVARAKKMTAKPVVAVGRFTSPDTMVRVIRNGTQDMIGAARPSIADPFLPRKIEDGRTEDIRECIGCNICYAHNSLGIPLRCTQNPTMGEEWRKGWHPERTTSVKRKERTLVVGAGPAGLEASRVLGQRGFDVKLAEASRTLGGRVTSECRLPGLSEWARVRDWRVAQIEKHSNIETYRESRLSVSDITELDIDHVFVATGAAWTTDGVGRYRSQPIQVDTNAIVIGMDDVLSGVPTPEGRVIIYDDDHYYLGSVLALELRRRGNEVTIVTPAGRAGQWGAYTEEVYGSNAALIQAGVEIITNQILESLETDQATISCIFSGKTRNVLADWMVPLTRREPNDSLYQDLSQLRGEGRLPTIRSLHRIGDCDAPGIIASAVYSGYKAAVELGEDASDPRDRYAL